MGRDDRHRTERHESEADEHRTDGEHEKAASEYFVQNAKMIEHWKGHLFGPLHH